MFRVAPCVRVLHMTRSAGILAAVALVSVLWSCSKEPTDSGAARTSMPGDGAARAARLDGALERAATPDIPVDAPLVAVLVWLQVAAAWRSS